MASNFRITAHQRRKEGAHTQSCKNIFNAVFKTQKVKISLTGFLSVFGECCYWFRKDDGVFIKYEGPGAKPGEKVIVALN